MAPGWLGLWLTIRGIREQNPHNVMDTRVEDSPLVHHVRKTFLLRGRNECDGLDLKSALFTGAYFCSR